MDPGSDCLRGPRKKPIFTAETLRTRRMQLINTNNYFIETPKLQAVQLWGKLVLARYYSWIPRFSVIWGVRVFTLGPSLCSARLCGEYSPCDLAPLRLIALQGISLRPLRLRGEIALFDNPSNRIIAGPGRPACRTGRCRAASARRRRGWRLWQRSSGCWPCG